MTPLRKVGVPPNACDDVGQKARLAQSLRPHWKFFAQGLHQLRFVSDDNKSSAQAATSFSNTWAPPAPLRASPQDQFHHAVDSHIHTVNVEKRPESVCRTAGREGECDRTWGRPHP